MTFKAIEAKKTMKKQHIPFILRLGELSKANQSSKTKEKKC